MFAVLPFGVYLITASPKRVCDVSKAMIDRIEHPYGGAVAASGQFDGLGYPWNMTEAAQGHTVTSTLSPTLIKYTNKISEVVCGEKGAGALLAFGFAVLAFAFFIILPLAVLSLRLVRAARRSGGCNECMSGGLYEVVTVRPHLHASRVHAVPGGQAVPGGRPVAGRASNVPIAKAVPIAEAASVRVAPTQMH